MLRRFKIPRPRPQHSTEPSTTEGGGVSNQDAGRNEGDSNAKEEGDEGSATAAATLNTVVSGATEEEAARAKATPAGAAAATITPTPVVTGKQKSTRAPLAELQPAKQEPKENLNTEAGAEVASSNDPCLGGGGSGSGGSPVGSAWLPPASLDEEEATERGGETDKRRGSRLSTDQESESESSIGPPRLVSESEER